MTEKTMVEINDNDFITWSEEGQEVEGYYTECSTVDINYRDIVTYSILTSEGVQSFLATQQLLKLFSRLPLGVYVRVTYKGETKTMKGYNLKLFSLAVNAEDASRIQEHKIKIAQNLMLDSGLEGKAVKKSKVEFVETSTL